MTYLQSLLAYLTPVCGYVQKNISPTEKVLFLKKTLWTEYRASPLRSTIVYAMPNKLSHRVPVYISTFVWSLRNER